MRKTLAEIAKLIEGEIVGDGNLVITGLSGIKEAKEGDLTFIANHKYFPLLETTKASAVIAPRNTAVKNKTLIRTENPSLAFSRVVSLFSEEQPKHFSGVHKTAVIADDARLGKNVAIGPYAVIGNKAVIGDGTVIYSGCFIGEETEIGRHCLIYPHVMVRERTTLGNCVIIHSGTVIGADGFGYTEVKGVHEKIPQVGSVSIEDDVEIGANVTIDRARFDKTIIGKGTKIDNLVQIAHNVIIGKHCLIISQVGISGSVEIKDSATLAGQAGVVGHITIGEGAVVAAQACVTKSVPAHTTVSGYPARPHDEAKHVSACVQRLPEYVKKINRLEAKIKTLEGKLKAKAPGSGKKKTAKRRK